MSAAFAPRVPAWAKALALGAASATAACGGGSPLLHPAKPLARGDVRAGAGFSANVTTGEAARALRDARAQVAQGGDLPGAPGSNEGYARGALVAAALAPGVAPWVSARVGLGSASEAGLAYTGRGVRLDARRAFDVGPLTFSAGAGLSAALAAREANEELPGLARANLRGFGFDVPLLLGWESTGGLYKVWGGVRGGLEVASVKPRTSEPRPPVGTPAPELEATRTYGGGVVGLATGFRHVHVALELEVSYQHVVGRFNGARGELGGLGIVPATALLWTF